MTQRGHTLQELLVSLVLIGMLAGLCATLTASARDDDRVARAYTADLRHLRDASDLLAARVRTSRTVVRTAHGLVIDGEPWTVSDGALHRGDAVAVRGVSRLEADEIRPGEWRLGVAPVPRRAGAAAPSLVTTVRPRAGDAR